jgi:uncharacterized coiled-coil DUF342 family protein
MNIAEGRLSQLQHARDEAKQQMDAVASQRDQLRLQRQRLLDESDRVQTHLDIATRQGDLNAMQAAKARLVEIRNTRDDLFDMISAVGNRHGLLQGDYGRAFDEFRHAENDAEFLARRIPDLRRRLATAQHRASAYSVYNNNTSPESLSAELRSCEGKYLTLTGQSFSEQFPAAAA